MSAACCLRTAVIAVDCSIEVGATRRHLCVECCELITAIHLVRYHTAMQQAIVAAAATAVSSCSTELQMRSVSVAAAVQHSVVAVVLVAYCLRGMSSASVVQHASAVKHLLVIAAVAVVSVAAALAVEQ
jgi:hypothetical protein